jgi:LysM repeat protein
MKILKILGIAAALHALALLLIFANPGCSASKAGPEASPITAAPAPDSGGQSPASIAPALEPATIRYSPTRPGTAVASALATQPVADVTPATTYAVVRGDSVWSVAKKNQLPQADLEAANNLKATSVLHVGQKLIIPSRPSRPGSAVAAPAPEAAPAEQAPADRTVGDSTRHTVKPGETLGGIARKYGVKQGDIAVTNNITDPRKIHPGQELVIPSKSSSPASKQSKGSKARAQPSEASAAPAAKAPGSEQDLDAGLKAPSPTDVPVIKIDEPAGGQQPKSP